MTAPQDNRLTIAPDPLISTIQGIPTMATHSPFRSFLAGHVLPFVIGAGLSGEAISLLEAWHNSTRIHGALTCQTLGFAFMAALSVGALSWGLQGWVADSKAARAFRR